MQDRPSCSWALPTAAAAPKSTTNSPRTALAWWPTSFVRGASRWPKSWVWARSVRLPPTPQPRAGIKTGAWKFGCDDSFRTLTNAVHEGDNTMAVKIEKGGWIFIFIIGLALVGFGLHRYGYLDLDKLTGGKGSSGSSAKVDTTKPLELPVSTSSSDDNPEVRVRVNVWVGCVGGLVANGGLETAPDSIFAQKGLKVSFKIIDDWTEGASALATNNVDVMLTTLDVYAKDYGQFQEKGFGSHAFLMVDWSRGADGVIGKQGINSIEDLAGKTVAFAPYTPSHFLL